MPASSSISCDERLVALELRIVLDHHQQPAERAVHRLPRRDALLGRVRAGHLARALWRCRRTPSAPGVAVPFTVSTRLPIRSLRRWSWLSTCAHCWFTASFDGDELVVVPDQAAADHHQQHRHHGDPDQPARFIVVLLFGRAFRPVVGPTSASCTDREREDYQLAAAATAAARSAAEASETAAATTTAEAAKAAAESAESARSDPPAAAAADAAESSRSRMRREDRRRCSRIHDEAGTPRA